MLHLPIRCRCCCLFWCSAVVACKWHYSQRFFSLSPVQCHFFCLCTSSECHFSWHFTGVINSSCDSIFSLFCSVFMFVFVYIDQRWFLFISTLVFFTALFSPTAKVLNGLLLWRAFHIHNTNTHQPPHACMYCWLANAFHSHSFHHVRERCVLSPVCA